MLIPNSYIFFKFVIFQTFEVFNIHSLNNNGGVIMILPKTFSCKIQFKINAKHAYIFYEKNKIHKTRFQLQSIYLKMKFYLKVKSSHA